MSRTPQVFSRKDDELLKLLEMEVEIYSEYLKNVTHGKYDGLVVYQEIHSGQYLQKMNCKTLNPRLFDKVAPKIHQDMLSDLEKEIQLAPAFVRNRIKNAKYGESVYSVNINKNIINNINKKIEQLQIEINKLSEKNINFFHHLARFLDQTRPKNHMSDKSKTL